MAGRFTEEELTEIGFNVAHVTVFGWALSGFAHSGAKMPDVSPNPDNCRRAFGSAVVAG